MTTQRLITEVGCDGSPEGVDTLVEALSAALAGGAAVLPYHGRAPQLPPRLVDQARGAALVIETSGSTGEPKRVLLSASALRASAQATHRRLGGPGHWLLALPAHHVAGAQVIVRALLAGRTPWVLDGRGGFRAERFAVTAAELLAATEGERRYLSLVPTQLHRLLTAGGPALAALRQFDGVLVGGAATPPALLDSASACGVRVITTYGMSETAGGCVYDGVPLDGVEVRLAPDRSTTLAGSADGPQASGPPTAATEPVGRIWLAGPMLASGYLGDPARTAEAFVDGWFRTSDVGRWGSDGRLQVLGRADDVIISGGEKVHPAAVERVLAAQRGVRAACVVAVDDPEWGQLVAAAVECADPASFDPGELDHAVRAELGAASVPRLLRALPELPLRGIGKPDRAKVAQLLTEASTGEQPNIRHVPDTE